MKNKDAIIVILLVLVLVIAVTAVIYISIVKTSQNNVGTSNVQNNTTTNDPTTEKVPTSNSEVENNKPQTSDKTETNTKLEQAYKKYSNLQWQREGFVDAKDWGIYISIDAKSNNVKLTYMENGNEKTVTINNIEGTPKYVAGRFNCGGYRQSVILTEEGTVYIGGETTKGDAPSVEYKKLNLGEKILDVAALQDKRLTSCFSQVFYFLTETGKLIDVYGETYEEKNEEYKKFLGNIEMSIYVYNNNNIGYILNENCSDVGCKEIRGKFEYQGKEIVAKKIFIVERTLEGQELETIGRSSIYTAYVYTENGELLYINDYEMNKLALKLHATGVENVEQTSTNKVKVTYTNGKNETFNGAKIEF